MKTRNALIVYFILVLVAMKLQERVRDAFEGSRHLCRRRIHEQQHRGDEGGQGARQLRHACNGHGAWAGWVEHEADGVGAGAGGVGHVGLAGQATNLDAGAGHGVQRRPAARRR